MTHFLYIFIFLLLFRCSRISPARVDSSLQCFRYIFPSFCFRRPSRYKKIFFFFFKYHIVNPSIRVRSIGLPTRGNVQCTKRARRIDARRQYVAKSCGPQRGRVARATHRIDDLFISFVIHVFSFHRLFIQLRDGTYNIHSSTILLLWFTHPPIPPSPSDIARAIGEFNPRRTFTR